MDLVVTVPKPVWLEWLAEGDLAGHAYGTHHPEFGRPDERLEWHFYLGGSRPPIEPGDRLYVVAWGRLRGFSEVVRVERDGGCWAIVRRHEAEAVTVPDPIPGFRGFRKVWWSREAEQPYPEWYYDGVEMPQAELVQLTRWYEANKA